jgi:hypothetical protein
MEDNATCGNCRYCEYDEAGDRICGCTYSELEGMEVCRDTPACSSYLMEDRDE